MKIKKTLAIILFLTLCLTSCKDDSIKCDGYYEQKTVISILKDEIFKEKTAIQYSLGIDEKYLENFFENNLKLSLIRTTSINKELKICECSAQLGLNLKQEIIDFVINNADGSGANLEYAQERLKNMVNFKVDLDYKIQETNDNNFIAETSIPTGEIGRLLTTSFLFDTKYKEKNTVGKIDTYKDSRGDGGKYTIEYLKENKIKITYTYFDYSDSVILGFNHKTSEIINETDWKEYELSGDNLIVDGKEGKVIYEKEN